MALKIHELVGRKIPLMIFFGSGNIRIEGTVTRHSVHGGVYVGDCYLDSDAEIEEVAPGVYKHLAGEKVAS